MEATVASSEKPDVNDTPAVEPEPEESFNGAAEATRTTEELFQWSSYVHVGAGAEECEHKLDGECKDADHFHCWLCLPNIFQVRDINEKARAAKARRRRSLQQEDSDAAIVLAEQLEAWQANDKTFDGLLQVMATRNVQRQFAEIAEELAEDDQFENRSQDLEEYQRLLDVPEDDRDPEDWERLRRDMDDYAQEFEKRGKAREERELQALRAESPERVIEMERQFQIDEISSEHFLHVYYTWAYFICARVPSPTGHSSERIFKNPEDLRNAPPEVVNALRTNYRRLELRTTGRGDAAGN